MLNLIPLPYRILGGLALLAALFGGGVWMGHHWATVTAEAERVKERDVYIAQLGIQLKRADMLSAQLSNAEARVITKTVEVIKYVPKVTTGRKCLDAAAVSVLQPTASPDVPEAAGKPPEASTPDAAASDRDVAYWIAGANQLYETCAQRLNALIEFYQ